jgi:hypothetical protein
MDGAGNGPGGLAGADEAFQLQVRYHMPRHELTIRVTVRGNGLDHITGTVAAITSQQNAENRSPVLGAPSRIRTCAHGSGDRWPSRIVLGLTCENVPGDGI